MAGAGPRARCGAALARKCRAIVWNLCGQCTSKCISISFDMESNAFAVNARAQTRSPSTRPSCPWWGSGWLVARTHGTGGLGLEGAAAGVPGGAGLRGGGALGD